MTELITLEGGCQVADTSRLALNQHDGFLWKRVVGQIEGTKKLSLYYFEINETCREAIKFGDSESVLFLVSGAADIEIGGRPFKAQSGCGIHIRAGEAFLIRSICNEVVKITVTVCPALDEFSTLPTSGDNFDARFPDRIIDGEAQSKQSSGDRFYRLLVGPHNGSENVTQFIGMVPASKAPEHYHLYEETIYILSGHGRMWSGESSTAVAAGSVIFLPRRQVHCLECTDPDGMLLMGSFYPAGSPAINYETAEIQ